MTDKTGDTKQASAAPGVPVGEVVDLTGQTLGDYRILRRLGEGGMGQVYLAEQTSLQRRVALKMLRGELANNEASRKRFEAEAMAVARLNHANIVQVYAIGEFSGLRYMALEYIDGRNLRDYLDRKGPPELPIALSIMRQVAAAIQRAGEVGIIHRDIKPENILLTRKGEVKVADFGISRFTGDGPQALNLTKSGTTIGTPLYMSPEQVEGKPLDVRTDIYSLGVTCFHMLAGQPPFEGDNAYAVALAHVRNDPPPLESLRPDLPPGVCTAIHKMMAKKPEERYQTAREVLKDLKLLAEVVSGANQRPVECVARPVPTAPTLPAPSSATGNRRRLVWIVTGSLVAAAAVGIALGFVLRPTREREAEEEKPPVETPGAQAVLGKPADQESALRLLIQESENPKDRGHIQGGVSLRTQLGVVLLKRREQDPKELQRAEEFFQELATSKVKEYVVIGKTGQAIVWAFQDKTKESIDRFVELLPDLRPGRPQIEANRDWYKQIRDALDHNQRNSAPRTFPKELLDLIPRPFFPGRPLFPNKPGEGLPPKKPNP